MSTAAVASPVNFGLAVQDNATLGGTAKKPGSGGPSGSNGSINPTTLGGNATGTITFTLYKNDCTTLATGTGTNPQTITTVSGNGTYGPVSFQPDAPGTYHWVATYGGDLPNTQASPATDSPCPDSSEEVVVRQIPTEITTAQRAYPNDSQTITSSLSGNNLPSGGTVKFYLYGPTTGGNSALVNCQAHGTTLNSGGLLYTETANSVGGTTHSVTVPTSNTSVSVNTSDTYYWRVTYATGDTAHTGRQSDCTENTALTFTNDLGTGTVFP